MRLGRRRRCEKPRAFRNSIEILAAMPPPRQSLKLSDHSPESQRLSARVAAKPRGKTDSYRTLDIKKRADVFTQPAVI